MKHYVVRARAISTVSVALALCVCTPPAWADVDNSRPGARVLLDAHNCYPYDGRWADRIDRALSTGLPVALEADLVWYTDKRTGRSRSILSHGKPYRGTEPTLRDYVFERIRPKVEAALARGRTADWPLVTVNLCFKSNESEHLQSVWSLLGEYESWLCTAGRTTVPGTPSPLSVGPVLVLTGSANEQEAVFHDAVPVGGRLRVFGSVHVNGRTSGTPVEEMVGGGATNYRRWWNNPWSAVEAGGQRRAGTWTGSDAARLEALVNRAHALGLWIRFYTLNGHARAESQGWGWGSNFGSLERAQVRWRAAIEAGVDFVATDQYEQFAELKRRLDGAGAPAE